MQERSALPDWGVEPAAPRRGHLLQRAAVLAIFVLVAFALTYLVAPQVGLVPVFIVLLLLVGAAFWWVNVQGLLALRSIDATAVTSEADPRLVNISAGLASDIGMKAPRVFVSDSDGPNAMVCIARGPAIAVTRTLLDDYTRTELEAVVAHCLVRLAAGSVERAMVSVALGPLGTKSVPPIGPSEDVRAAALTRYPPALASAIEKAAPRTGRFAALWFVPAGPLHASQADRAAAVRDL